MSAREESGRWRRRARVTWAVLSFVVLQSFLLGLAALPAALLLPPLVAWLPSQSWVRVVGVAVGWLPIYVVCAFTLAVATAAVVRLVGWRTTAGLDAPIAEYDWPLLDWARRAMCTHVVRLLVGEPFRGSPLWTLFIRLNGAQVGRGVWVNSVAVIDHGLLSFGDGTVIGIDVEIGDGCRVGALSVVPKHTRLEAGGTYVGTPVRRIDRD